MDTLTTGRPLDDTGEPTDGPALEVDPDGPAMALFSESSHALASSPGMGFWSTILAYPEPGADRTPAMLVWLAPDATELPPHVHVSKTETFRTLDGELTVVVDGRPERVGAGEEHTVEPGESHYFRNDTDGFVAFRVEVPWTRTIDTQYASAGFDHDGYFGDDGAYGEPDLVQGLLLAEYVSEETRIDLGPRIVQQALWASVGRLAKWAGRSAMDERYLEDEYWETTVEQPER